MEPRSRDLCVDRSIPFGDDEAILQHFHEHGFVVVADVFSDEEIHRALDELWTSPRLLARNGSIQQGKPESWTKENGWPQQDGGKNFLESLDPFQDLSCWELALHDRVEQILSLLWRAEGDGFDDGSDEKVVFLGRTPRWGVMRPSGTRPEWRTLEQWLHWDQNPWSQPGFGWIQAFACITPQTSQSGGLLCVPGFQKHWSRWGEEHPEGTVKVDGKEITRAFGAGNPFPVPPGDAAHEGTVRILAPKGSVVLWDSRLPHQNFPNSSDHESVSPSWPSAFVSWRRWATQAAERCRAGRSPLRRQRRSCPPKQWRPFV
ncbi:unnamed protein product [Durusdinium trenchii]|uniref:Phytanoyl-CoA dioxygenase family protein n=1 Tax=Durusdinium trenchii TaxID=1381693 RepID=A0ABP0H9E7_9DINO